MYTELIKRSRAYLDFNRNLNLQENDPRNGPNQSHKIAFLKDKVARESSKSLLLTKIQLQQLIMILHTENIVLRGLKNPSNSQPLAEKLKREQKQQQQVAHIQQLKFKLEMYSKSVKNDSKRIEELKFKIQVCEEYLKQKGVSNVKKHKQTDKSERSFSKSERSPKKYEESNQNSRQNSPIKNKSKQKNFDFEAQTKNEVPIIELIKGFEDLNKQNDSLLGSLNEKEAPSPKNGSKQGVKGSRSLSKEKPKDLEDDSSSLIETSSFIGNYNQFGGMGGFDKFSWEIKEILDESEISSTEKKSKAEKIGSIESREDLNRLKIPQTPRGQGLHRKFSQISESGQSNLEKKQSSEESVSNLSEQNLEEGMSLGIRQQLLTLKNSYSNMESSEYQEDQPSINEKKLQTKEKEQKQSAYAEKKETFLNVLSKFNSKDFKGSS